MGRKLALLVGNGIYNHQKYPPLGKSAADVNALAVALWDPKTGAFDDVKVLTDEPVDTIRQAIDVFFSNKKRDDLLLLYLTGHGDVDKQLQWYFICRDTKPAQLFSTAIPAHFIQSVMEACNSNQQIIILDSCYGGAFFEGSKGVLAVGESAKKQLAGRGRVVLAATSATQLAWEGDQPTSIFTSFLVHGIKTGEADKDKDGFITIDEWFDYAFDRVINETPNQSPTKWVYKQQGSIFIAKNPFLRETPKPQPFRESPSPTKPPPSLKPEGVSLLRTLARHTNAVYSVAFSPDGQTLASCGADQTIKLWNLASGQEVRTLTRHTNTVNSVAFSPDGQTLASGSYDDTIKLWNLASGQEVRTLTGHTDAVHCVAFSPDGQTLASGSEDKTIKLWDFASSKDLHTLTGHTDAVECVAFSPDGQTLASGDFGGTIKLWDIASGQELRTFTGPYYVYSVAFSPDGQTLASGGRAIGTIKLWNPATGQDLRTLIGHRTVRSVAFSPNGQTLASGSEDKTIKLWDFASGKDLHTLAGHTDAVWSVAFSPDGQTLASGSADQTIKIWGKK